MTVKKKNRKSNRGFTKKRHTLSLLDKVKIGGYIIEHPNMPIKTVAKNLEESLTTVYLVMTDVLVIKRVIKFRDEFNTTEVQYLLEMIKTHQ